MMRGRLPTALVAIVSGVATGTGGLLTWLNARGTRPSIGMEHASFSRMLVYTSTNHHQFVGSVAFVLLLLGIAMVLGGVSGLRVLTALGPLLALVVAGWWIGLTTHRYNTPKLSNFYYVNPAHLPWADLRAGAWLTIGGAAVGLLSSLVRRGWLTGEGRSVPSTNAGWEPRSAERVWV